MPEHRKPGCMPKWWARHDFEPQAVPTGPECCPVSIGVMALAAVGIYATARKIITLARDIGAGDGA